MSKPFVESICWRDLGDFEGHYLPHGGLCKASLEPKLAYRELRNFKSFISNLDVEAKKPKTPPQASQDANKDGK